MPVSFFKNACLGTLVLSLAASIGFAAAGRNASVAGVWVGAAWIFLNTFFLFRVIETGMNPGPKKHMIFLTLVKFPVLYVVGYFILAGRAFPLDGVLVGLTSYMAAFTACWIKANGAVVKAKRA